MGQQGIVTRATCYAFISSIESDLRCAIYDIAEGARVEALLPEDVRANANRRWLDDNTAPGNRDVESELDLLDYVDFADLAKILHQLEQSPLFPSQSIRDISNRLTALAPARNRIMHARPLEPEDFSSIVDFAAYLMTSASWLDWHDLRTVDAKIRQDPSFPLGLEIPTFWRADVAEVNHNLPLPDFDDTGFLGRKEDRRQLLKHLLGHHPVVTIVGEGGVGKTALALRCLYDIIDSGTAPYDAVVWITSKTKSLTGEGIRELTDAITSTMDIYTSIATRFGAEHDPSSDCETDLTEIVRDILSDSRVLLAIDNLETVTDKKLRDLILDVPTGSKVLLTSRYGLGELELRYQLDAMDRPSSVGLMRRYAKAINLNIIGRMADKRLDQLCAKLFDNPLLIKWFVSSVARGADPEALLASNAKDFGIALQYCFMNLFEQLSAVERGVLHVLVSAKRPLTLTEIAYLCAELRQEQVIVAVQGLHQGSMVMRRDAKKGGSVLYAVTDAAREYVSRYAPPDSDTFRRTLERIRNVDRMVTDEVARKQLRRYDINTLEVASRDEQVCAITLRQALQFSKEGKHSEAQIKVSEAKAILPAYAEVYRVSGFVESRLGNHFAADEEYQRALEYNPRSQATRYAYGIFLMKCMEDYVGALAQLDDALTSDPGRAELLGPRALALTRLARFQEAIEIYETLLEQLASRERKWRITTYDQAADAYRRWAEHDSTMREYDRLKMHVMRGLEIIRQAVRDGDSDVKLIERTGRVIDEGLRYAIYRGDDDFALEVLNAGCEICEGCREGAMVLYHRDKAKNCFEYRKDILEALERIGASSERQGRAASLVGLEGDGVGRREASLGRLLRGRVTRIQDGPEYGFIQDEEGRSWFFHRNHMAEGREWLDLRSGDDVEFTVGRNHKGPCAGKVRILR